MLINKTLLVHVGDHVINLNEVTRITLEPLPCIVYFNGQEEGLPLSAPDSDKLRDFILNNCIDVSTLIPQSKSDDSGK